ncbi:unnamed protein product [Bursaphelenchus xylophilus]|uniref:(pine wood nematode) hypothetical protein n=1 Tax=Bursaphelenchus xylophilus TaxID=6326 RepID=A0A1I7SR33_BURXY|nr:unnamed protein product [Bursaphelenchus xylophilus]CAG9110768.1 unnamed protein product [Bursaphelenchus xylophilus]
MTSFGLEGKLALVTGSAQGIGAATARKFAEHGANVILVDLNENVVKKTAEGIQKDFPNQKIVAEVCDVTQKKEVDALVARIEKQFPKSIDALVNNAAICKFTPYLEIKEEEWDKIIATNLKSVHLVTQAFAKQAVAQKRPLAVVNLSSITTNAGMVELAHYVATKDGINGLTKVLAKELGPYNIRVNAVKPGWVETPMTAHLDDAARAEIARGTPLGRMAKPEDIANVIVFFASDLASFCTASFVDVNGGVTL